MIDFSFTEEQLKLKAEVIEFAQNELSPGAAIRDRQQIFDRRLWELCGEMKLQGLVIPEQYGGRGLDAVSAVLALEALGYGSEDSGLAFSLAAHLLACAVPVWLHGTEAQKERLLPGLCGGSLIATNAMTEATAGSDAYKMAATATKEGENYILNGRKTYCSNGPVADVVVTYANTDAEKGFFGGISAFVLEKPTHPFEQTARRDKMGVRSCQLGEVYFDGLRIGQDALLGKEGAGAIIFNQSMEWERICLGALHLGTMDKLLEKATAFAKKRKSRGKAIAQYQAVAHPLVDLKLRLESARLLTYRAAWKLELGEKVAMDAALCKLAVSETFRDLAVQLMQLYAGAAFREHSEMERNLRDAMGATIYSGTSEVLRNIAARHMKLS